MKQIVLPHVGGISQFTEGPKTEEGKMHPFFWWPFKLGRPLVFSCPQTIIYTIVSPDFPAFGLKLSHTTGFPGFLACRQQNMGLLRPLQLCEPISHNKSFHIYKIGSVSLENPNTSYHWVETQEVKLCIYVYSTSFFTSRKHTDEVWQQSPVLCMPSRTGHQLFQYFIKKINMRTPDVKKKGKTKADPGAI